MTPLTDADLAGLKRDDAYVMTPLSSDSPRYGMRLDVLPALIAEVRAGRTLAKAIENIPSASNWIMVMERAVAAYRAAMGGGV